MARRINPFEEDSLPPFDGFPKDALRFLRELKKNNDRDWFNENRKRYEQNVREPMQMLLASLAVRMKGVHPDIVVDPKKSMYRIHRDVRFSQDKSPYKTWVAASFTYDGHDRKYDAAFYFHITPEEIGIGGGLYAPSGDKLKKLRAAIAQDAKPLRSILAGKKLREQFGEMEGEELQRAPQGYDPEHPDMDLLRKKQFLCWKTLPTGRATEAAFLDDLVAAFAAMAPFIAYLVENS